MEKGTVKLVHNEIVEELNYRTCPLKVKDMGTVKLAQ